MRGCHLLPPARGLSPRVGGVGVPQEALRRNREVLLRPDHVALPQAEGLYEQLGGLGDILDRDLATGEGG